MVDIDPQGSMGPSKGLMNSQGCVMSPWLFNIFMDGCMRKMKSKVVNAGAKLKLNGEVWSVVTCLFADDTVLLG